MSAIPVPEKLWCKVHGQLRLIVGDATDPDLGPESIGLTGDALLSPVLEENAVVPHIATNVPSDVSYAVSPVRVRFEDGTLVFNGQPYVYLLAGAPHLDGGALQWRVEFSELTAEDGTKIRPRSYRFLTIPGGEISLTRVQPAVDVPAPIIQGPQGKPGQRGLRGATGPRGEPGQRGLKGDPGDSAYTIARRHGATGSEADWARGLNTASDLGTRELTHTSQIFARALTTGAAHNAAVDLIKDTAGARANQPVNIADYMTGPTDMAGLQAAIKLAQDTGRGIYQPPHHEIVANAQISMTGIHHVNLCGLITTSVNLGLWVGSDSRRRPGQYIYIRSCEFSDPKKQGITVMCVGMKQAYVHVQKASGLALYAPAEDSRNSISYCTFQLGTIGTLEVNAQASTSWITECLFIGGDIKKLEVMGQYSSNQLLFLKPCFEKGEMLFNTGSRIRMIDARCEGGTRITFKAPTSRIIIEDNYVSNPTSYAPGAVVVEDKGVDNMVITPYDQLFRRYELAAAYAKPTDLDTPPGKQAATTKAWQYVLDTGVLPCSGATVDIDGTGTHPGQYSMRTLYIQSDASCWRPEVHLYAKDGTKLTTGVGIDTTGGWTWSSAEKCFRISTNVSAARVVLNRPEVAYLRVRVRMGNKQASYKLLRLFAFVPTYSSDLPVLIARDQTKITV